MLHLLLILIAALSCIILLQKNRKNESFHPPPGPKGLPFTGNLHQYDPLNPHIYFAKLAKIYGPIMSLRIGCRPVVVLQSAKMAKEVLKTQDHNFCSRPSMVGPQRLSYNGLDIGFAPYNECFREMKKISVVHLLSSKRVHSFASIRDEEIKNLIKKISSLSCASEIVNLSEIMMIFASNNICRIAFGKRYGDDEGSKRSRFHSLLNDSQEIQAGFFYSDYIPSFGWLDMLTGKSSKLERVCRNLDAFYEEIIRDHLDPNRPKSDHEDIVDVLLQLKKERAFGFDLTLDHIKAVLMDIFAAGTDSSTVMTVWAMTELMKNPTVMKKVQAEIRNAIHDKVNISIDDLPKLKYFEAVVKETFRFRPAGPLLMVRETLQKCTIEGYDILPKTLVHVNVWAIQRDPISWKEPEMFMPERFLGSSVDFRGQDFELIPFGAGRRMCPGMLLGVSTFELVLANLLYSFDWELPNGMKKEDIDDEVIPGIAMHKKNPLCLLARQY